MSECEHPARETLIGMGNTAVSKTSRAFVWFPGALAIARNGGSELTLRSAILGFLEQAGFVAFTQGFAEIGPSPERLAVPRHLPSIWSAPVGVGHGMLSL